METGAAAQPGGMNQEKFEELFSKYGKLVLRTAYAATGNKYDAADIQQDIFLRLIDQNNTLEHVSSPAGYLCVMAFNEAKMRFRARERRKHSDDDVEELKDPASEGNLCETDMQERLLEALTELPPEHAEVLMLWSAHGYTDAEIAEMLGKTRNAVAVTLHRAKAQLKELLELKREANNETRRHGH
jgi:RNA polymerase sigma-70 factor, ECF subfamily